MAREPTPSVKSKQLEQCATVILNHTPAPGGLDSKSLLALLSPPQAAAYDAAVLGSAGCDHIGTMLKAGMHALSLLSVFGHDVVAAAGCDMSYILVCRASYFPFLKPCTFNPQTPCTSPSLPSSHSPSSHFFVTPPSARRLQLVHNPATSQSR
jgi:hypothetical protein